MDWKKEIKLSDLVGRKNRGDEALPPEESAEPTAKPEKTSIWKKEISFGRKKGEPKDAAPPAPASEPPAAAAEPAAPSEATPPVPAIVPPAEAQAGAAPAPPAEPAALVAPAAQPSSSGESQVSGPAPAHPENPSSVPAGSAAPPGDLGVPPMSSSSIQPPVVETELPQAYVPVSDPAAAALPPVAAPEAPATELAMEVPQALPPSQSEIPSPEPTAVAPVQPAPITHPPTDAAPMPPTSGPAQAAVPTSTPPSAPSETAPEPASAVSPPVPAQTPYAPQAQPALPPEPVAQQQPAPAPEPEVVHPPVPADQLPPEKDGAKRPAFYKREISFGRKRGGDTAPKRDGDSAPKRMRAPRRPAAARGKTSKSLVGLKIGASQIAAARVSNNGHAELLQVAREPLQSGIVVGGELRDPDALSEALKEFFAKHKLPKRGVRLGIANNRIGVRAFELAGIEDPRQLSNAIRFRAQEALPIPIEDAVLDYQVLAERVTDEGETIRRILLVVAYRELVDRYVDACRKAGIALVGIDLEGFALLRSLQAPSAEPVGDAAMVAVTIGHERTTFAVSDGRMSEFTRVLEWGGTALNVAIARALDMAPGEAEPIKHELSLGGGEVPEGLTEAQAAAAREAISRQIQSFARELVSSLQFYQNQPGSLGIGEIAITGGTAHLPGLAQELQRLIGVTVRVGDPLARVKTAKKFREPEQIGSFAVAIGLGIDD